MEKKDIFKFSKKLFLEDIKTLYKHKYFICINQDSGTRILKVEKLINRNEKIIEYYNIVEYNETFLEKLIVFFSEWKYIIKLNNIKLNVIPNIPDPGFNIFFDNDDIYLGKN